MTTFRCRVILLDDTVIERDLEKKAVGQVLFDQVCEYLNLLERDYFGLADSSNGKTWLDFSKQVGKQITSRGATFRFSVKFYPPDPSALAEDLTRYLLCLQLRADILASRLPCPSDMLAVLGSYTIQSEFGDYNPELHGKEFFGKIPLAPNQTPELEEKVTEMHRTLISMSPARADQLFLQNAKTLDMYGVHLHPAKDASGADVMLGVCAEGLVVYEDEEKTQSFIWLNVVNVSYKRSNFLARIFQSEDASENTIRFILPSYRACKRLWRNAVEHHAFFRNLETSTERLLNLGPRFRSDGVSYAESLEASAAIKRPAPRFSRSAIKRKAKESLLVTSKRPNRTEIDDWFQVLGSDESWPTCGPDTDILESATFQLWKLQADDWFVLLEPRSYQPTFWPLKTLPLSLQPSQAEEQKEELEWIEGTSGKGIKVVKISNEVEAVTEQHEELELERNLMRPDIVGETLELDIGASEKIVTVVREKIEQGGSGEEIRTVIMYEQGTQEVEPYTGQSQEAFVEGRMRGKDVVETVPELMIKTSQAVSEEEMEELEETLLEVESIGQRLQDIERLKSRLQEVEILQQKLQEVQRGGRRQGERDDWYILLEPKLMESPAPRRLLGVETSERKLQDTEHKRQQPEDRGDWYLVPDPNPLVESSASAVDTAEQKAEIRQWIEGELQRANTLTPVQMKDDWYILLESIPRYTQSMQPALTPSETDLQSSWVHVVEEQKHLDEEKEWREERALHVIETQPTLPSRRVFDVHKETREEEVQLAGTQVKMITSVEREERREMMETSHEALQMNIIPFERRDVPSVSRETLRTGSSYGFLTSSRSVQLDPAEALPMTMISEDAADLRPQQTVTIQEKDVIFDEKPTIVTEKQVIVGGEERKIPATMRDVEDNWFVLFTPAQTEMKKAITTVFDVHKETREEEVQLAGTQVKMITSVQERREMIETSHEALQTNIIPIERRDVPSVPMTLISEDLRPQQTVTIQEKDVIFDKKPTIITEKQVIVGGEERKIPATMRDVEDNWFVLFTPAQIEKKKAIATETDLQSSWVHVVEEQKHLGEEKEWREERALHVIETQPTLPSRREEQTQKQVDEDWFVHLDVSPKKPVFDVHKETREEEVQLAGTQVKTITSVQERREMIETSHEALQTNIIPIERRDVPSVPMTLISEDLRPQQTVTIQEKDVIFDKKPTIVTEKQVIVGGVERKIPATMREDEDNWFVLFTPAQIEMKKVIATAEKQVKTITSGEERGGMIETSREALQTNPLPFQKRDVPSVPMTLISEDLRPQQTVTIQEKEVIFDKKPTIITEKQVIVRGVERKIPATMRDVEDNWFVLFTPAQIEKKKAIATAGGSDAWIPEEKEFREVQKGQFGEDVKRSHVVEDRRFHPYVPGTKAEEHHRVHHRIDDWFILLEPVSKKSVSVDRSAEEDRRRKEEVFKKQAMAEEKRKVAGFKPAPVIPSDQPMTSTPTAQYIRIARPTYQEESLKRLDVTQEIKRDIKQESKVETESIRMRKRQEKRVEGESIYIRHSILMLEDSDVTQEMVLRHHASVSELKRHFMEDVPVYGPTEWDKRLSTYTPVVFPQLSNGELFSGIDRMRADGLLAM